MQLRALPTAADAETAFAVSDRLRRGGDDAGLRRHARPKLAFGAVAALSEAVSLGSHGQFGESHTADPGDRDERKVYVIDIGFCDGPSEVGTSLGQLVGARALGRR